MKRVENLKLATNRPGMWDTECSCPLSESGSFLRFTNTGSRDKSIVVLNFDPHSFFFALSGALESEAFKSSSALAFLSH